MAQNWSNLEIELLELILQKLSSTDMVRFKSVCSSWNKAAKSYTSSPFYNQTPWLMIPNHYQNHKNKSVCSSWIEAAKSYTSSPFYNQMPWLMIPNYQNDHKKKKKKKTTNIANSQSFFSIADNKVYEVNNLIEGYPDCVCAGSINGWLVILDHGICKQFILLLNLFTRVQFQIPPLTTVIALISKAILLSDPSCNNNFTVVVMYGQPLRLAFYKQGHHHTWTPFGNMVYDDIICRDGHLHALSLESYEIEVWDFEATFPTKIAKFGFNKDVIPPNFSSCFFVESMGESLLVFRYVRAHPIYFITRFAVFKVDYTKKTLVLLQSLRDQALFLTNNQTISIATRDFPEFKENSIYITNGFGDKICNGGGDIRVYDLLHRLRR